MTDLTDSERHAIEKLKELAKAAREISKLVEATMEPYQKIRVEQGLLLAYENAAAALLRVRAYEESAEVTS